MTSFFEVQGCPNRKQKKENICVALEKGQRKRKTEKNRKQMKRQAQVYENLKLGD